MARRNGTKSKKPDDFPLCYVPCRVEPGMFREELLAYLEAANPRDPNQILNVQLLVDQRDVAEVRGTPKRHTPVAGWLRATLVGYVGEWAEVVLPQPSQPLGERVLVAGDSVKETPGK
jgi:hypothetical protein